MKYGCVENVTMPEVGDLIHKVFLPIPLHCLLSQGLSFPFPTPRGSLYPSSLSHSRRSEVGGPLPSGLGTSTNDFQATASYTVVTGFPCTLTRLESTTTVCKPTCIAFGDLNQVRPIEFLLAYK